MPSFVALIYIFVIRFGDDEWDHIIFTQQWPESSCEHVNVCMNLWYSIEFKQLCVSFCKFESSNDSSLLMAGSTLTCLLVHMFVINDNLKHLKLALEFIIIHCYLTHFQATGQHDCEIPSETTTWTVHGLWPTLGNSKGPNFCNDSWKFDPSEIEVTR